MAEGFLGGHIYVGCGHGTGGGGSCRIMHGKCFVTCDGASQRVVLLVERDPSHDSERPQEDKSLPIRQKIFTVIDHNASAFRLVMFLLVQVVVHFEIYRATSQVLLSRATSDAQLHHFSSPPQLRSITTISPFPLRFQSIAPKKPACLLPLRMQRRLRRLGS